MIDPYCIINGYERAWVLQVRKKPSSKERLIFYVCYTESPRR